MIWLRGSFIGATLAVCCWLVACRPPAEPETVQAPVAPLLPEPRPAAPAPPAAAVDFFAGNLDDQLGEGYTPVWEPKVTAAMLEHSLAVGTRYLLNSQRDAGNFISRYDLETKATVVDESPTRQAGVLWALASLHYRRPTPELSSSVRRGLAFFKENSVYLPGLNATFVKYPKAKLGDTGCQALVCLSLIEFLRTDRFPDGPTRDRYQSDLDSYMRFLLSLRQPNGLFGKAYLLISGQGTTDSSPYYDGEALLAMVRAAKYAGFARLRGNIMASAEAMYRAHVVEAREQEPDSDATKGFFQWGCLAFHELTTTDWPEAQAFAERTVELAGWMLYVHQTMSRRANTAYAVEGLAVAWELARRRGDLAAQSRLGYAIDRTMLELTSWQIGGPCEMPYLQQRRAAADPVAFGGVLSYAGATELRTDVVQHQMHAAMLLRNFIYRN